MSLKEHIRSRPVLTSVGLWLVAMILTLACLSYQDKTGPTYPLEGSFHTAKGTLHFTFLRSETIGSNLRIILREPVPEGITGYVKYRRFRSYDAWSVLPFTPREFQISHRGRKEMVNGLGAELPSLKERAGKYEYFVFINGAEDQPVSVTGTTPVYARYKAEVPTWVLVVHIVFIFASMALAIRTVLEALIDGNYTWMMWATVISLLLGGFIFGPIVQWYAFGVWWSGIPSGYDWTDNKVLVELVFWLVALLTNHGGRRNRRTVYLAGVATFIVYFIPHSVFGSEYNYTTGTGRGTAG